MSHVLHTPRLQAVAARVPPPVMGALRFGGHLGEMCAAMCVGVAVLDIPFVAAAKALGASDPVRDIPEVAAVVVAVNMSVAMGAWMRLRHHEWRCVYEMGAAMLVEAAVLIAAAAVGVVDRTSLIAVQHALMVPAMLVPMLLRLDVYTGRVRHDDMSTSMVA